MSDDPRIYVACLASYNNGVLHGCWIDANDDVSEMQAEIDQMLTSSRVPNAEEWAIHDYEGFGSLKFSEYERVSALEKIAALCKVAERSGESVECVATFLGWDGCDVDDLRERFESAFHGEAESLREFAEKLFDELYLESIPEALRSYINYDAFTRDLEGDYSFVGRWVFESQ